MIKLSRILLFVLFLGVIGSILAVRNANLSGSRHTMIEKKRLKIENEIAQLKDHPWAWRYDRGSKVFGVSLTLAPENGFADTCYGTWSQRFQEDNRYGTVDWNGNIVKLTYAFDLEDSGFDRCASEYKPIRWGERHYLIPSDEIVQFCNAVNSRDEPRNCVRGHYFLRWGDEKKEAKGKPELPEKYMPYLLDEPVDATIVSVKDIRRNGNGQIATIIVNKGKKDGLLPDMELWSIMENEHILVKVTLTRIDETQSEGEFDYQGYHFVLVPIEDWQLSTCPRWKR